MPRLFFIQANFSFSGALQPLSKLIICAVMLRGRHRGLPVAIDRAVMLPSEFQPPTSQDETRVPSWEDEEQNEDADAYEHEHGNGNVDVEGGVRGANVQMDEKAQSRKSGSLEVPRRSSWMPSSNAAQEKGESEMQRRAGRMIDEELQELARVDS